MSKTNYANATILKKMAWDPTSEPKTVGTQTTKSLITLHYLKTLNLSVSDITMGRHDDEE